MRHEMIPNLRYADAPRAIGFLCDAFGFTRHAVFEDEGDPSVIQHAQLLWNDRMIMLSSVIDSEFMQKSGIKTVLAAGAATMTLYLIVADVDAHAERARAAGAEIIMEPVDQSYGGRGYSARDLEGNIWSFGSYDPWASG